MSQLLVRFCSGNLVKWGMLESAAPVRADDILRVRELLAVPASISALLEELEGGAEFNCADHVTSVRAIDLLSPVTEDARLLCQGLNFATHAGEAGHAERKANLFFMKASSTLSGAFADIVKPAVTELLDFEVEVGLILRRDLVAGDVVTPENIGDFVAGVTLCNDVSARDVMFGASFFQWFQGKSYRTFCPAGPALYYLERGEVADVLDNLEISLSLNGEKRQSAATRDWIFKPHETLTQLAGIMNLNRGDMILTGTPGGVLAQGSPALIDILRRDILDDARRRTEIIAHLQSETRFLQAGDRLELTLRNTKIDLDLGGHSSNVSE